MTAHEIRNIICKAMQQAFLMLSKKDVEQAFCWIKNSLCSNAMLIKRMALLLLRDFTGASEKQKADLILSNFDLHSTIAKEQLFKIIATIFDGLDHRTQSLILERIWDVDTSKWVNADADERKRSKFYMRYNWLYWLKTRCKPNNEIGIKLEIIKEEYPYFQPRERPDLSFYPTEARWGGESPISSTDLNRMTGEEAYRYVTGFKEDKASFGPDRFGLLQTLREVCSKDFPWAINYLSIMSTEENRATDLWSAVLNGLEVSTGTKDHLLKVLNVLPDESYRVCGDVVAQYIFQVLQNDSILKHLSKNLQSKLRQTLNRLWVNRADRIIVKEDNWPFNSHYNPTGLIAHIMFRMMFVEDAKNGIPAWIKSFVAKRIENEKNVEMFISVMCGYSAQLYYADADWTKRHVFCFLSDENIEIKQAAWEGFLAMVHNFSTQFGAEILPVFKGEKDIMKHLTKEFRSIFIHDYTLLIMYLIDDPINDYVMEMIDAGTEGDRGRFAQTIREILDRMNHQAADEAWNRWLREYWEIRNKGMPRPIDSIEYSQMLRWLFHICDVVTGIGLALVSNIKCQDYGPFLHELEGSELLNDHPQQCAELLLHLARMEDGRYNKFYLKSIVEELFKKEIDESTMEELKLLIS